MTFNIENTIREFNLAFLALEDLKNQGKTMFDVKMANGQYAAFSTAELERAMSMFTRNDGRTPNEAACTNAALVEKNTRLIIAIRAAATLKK